MTDIHSTAIVHEGAILGEGSVVGPYSVIGPDVVLGENNRIGSHVVIEGHTTLGDQNIIYQFASVGSAPQDLKYQGEPSTLKVGSGNIIREYVTLQPGTKGGGMETTIGDQNLFMVSSHVGHDSHIGSKNVFANSVAIAGHVEIANGVILGGMSAVHQFVRIGNFGFSGAGSMVAQDLPPFCLAQGDRAELIGLNVVGLKRNGFSATDLRTLKEIYRALFIGDGTLTERLEQLKEKYSSFSPGLEFLEFIASSERGVISPRRSDKAESDQQE